MNTCLVCHESKLPAAFSVKRSARDGRNPYCKGCEKRRVAAYVASRPDYKAKKKAYDIQYNELNQIKKKKQLHAYHQKNRAANIEHAAKWALANPTARRAISKAYKGRRRAICEAGMGGAALQDWLADQFFFCSYCGENCAAKSEIDHIRPLSAGGRHEENNLTISCPTCNRTKSSKSLLLFLLERDGPRNTVTPEMIAA